MSSNRYLLISLILLWLCAGNAQSIFWQDHSLFYHSTDADENFGTKLDTGTVITFSPISSLTIYDQLYWTEDPVENAKQSFANKLHLGYKIQYKGLDAKLGYALHNFDSSEQLSINYNPVDPFFVRFEKRDLHHLEFDAQYGSSDYGVGITALARELTLVPHLIFGEFEGDMDRSKDDLYTGLSAFYKPSENSRIRTSYQHKKQFQDDYFDMQSSNLGLDYEAKLLHLIKLSASVDWMYRDSSVLSREQRNQIVSHIRYEQFITPQLFGFVSFTNRSCFADPSEDIYLLANYLRSHIQYHFAYDSSSASYLLAGLKIRPENKDAFHPDTGAYFAETDLKLGYGVYLGAACTLQKDFRDLYSAKLSYWFNPFSDIYLEYGIQHSNAPFLLQDSSLISLGSGIRW